MKSKIIAVDLAKEVFEVAVDNDKCRVLERHRLSRKAFSAFLTAQPPALVLFEACGTAHFWGRTAQALGHQVRLLPAQYTAPYRRRAKPTARIRGPARSPSLRRHQARPRPRGRAADAPAIAPCP